MPWPRWRGEWAAYWADDLPRFVHIVKVAIAVTMAMGLCMRLELRSPATAMVSCVIVMMHQQSGMVIARGFYRGLGMVCGSFAGLVLISLFAQQPVLFFIALAVWIGLCVFCASYYRNFQSYGFVLTGYGTAITAMPAWPNPYGVFDNVVFTVSEVVIGVVCACLASALIFPRPVTPALYASSQKNLTNLLRAIHRLLDNRKTSSDVEPFLDLIRERAGVEALRSGAVFEDPAMRLHHHLFLDLDRSFLNTVAGIHALQQLRLDDSTDIRVVQTVDSLIDAFLAIIPTAAVATAAGTTPAAAAEPVTRFQVETLAAHLSMLEIDLPARIGDLLHALADLPMEQRQFVATVGSSLCTSVIELRVLCERYVAARTTDRRAWSVSVMEAIGRIARTRATANRAAATIAGVRSAAAVLAVGAIWIASGWMGGVSAVVAVAITTALFALVPNPAAASRQIFCGGLCGWMAGFAFTFFLLPMLDGFTLLACCVAIAVMIGSYINTFPKVAVFGLGFNIYFCFIVAISNPVSYNPSAYLDTGFALLSGIATAAAAFLILAPRAGDWVSARYLKQIRALVSETARDGGLDDLLYRFELHIRDFILQIATAPTGAEKNREALVGWAFAGLEIGRAMIQTRMDTEQEGAALPPAWRIAQRDWLDALAAVFDEATPGNVARSLEATRHAREVLPCSPDLAVGEPMLTRFRMRALLHLTEITLKDDRLPLRQPAESAI
jgi:uncharacterized membrane protein YccC